MARRRCSASPDRRGRGARSSITCLGAGAVLASGSGASDWDGGADTALAVGVASVVGVSAAGAPRREAKEGAGVSSAPFEGPDGVFGAPSRVDVGAVPDTGTGALGPEVLRRGGVVPTAGLDGARRGGPAASRSSAVGGKGESVGGATDGVARRAAGSRRAAGFAGASAAGFASGSESASAASEVEIDAASTSRGGVRSGAVP